MKPRLRIDHFFAWMTLTAAVLVMHRVARSFEWFHFERQPALLIAGVFYVALWSAAMIAAVYGSAEFKSKLPESKPPGFWLLVEIVLRLLLLAIAALPIPMASLCNLVTWIAINIVMARGLRLEMRGEWCLCCRPCSVRSSVTFSLHPRTEMKYLNW